MAETRLLLVDDEEFFRESVAKELALTGYAVESAGSLEAARRLLKQGSFHLAVLDLRLPDGSGLDLLAEIKESAPLTEVVVLTAFGTIEEGVQAIKQGAHDFLTKPCRLDTLEAVLEKAAEKQSLERSNAALVRQVERLQPGQRFVGQSPQVRDMLRLVDRVAPTDSTVLIRGRSGVGKEMVANAIHRQQPARAPAVRGGGLRRAAREPAAERAVRAREGRLHRRGDASSTGCSRSPTAAPSSSTRSPRSRRRCR